MAPFCLIWSNTFLYKIFSAIDPELQKVDLVFEVTLKVISPGEFVILCLYLLLANNQLIFLLHAINISTRMQNYASSLFHGPPFSQPYFILWQIFVLRRNSAGKVTFVCVVASFSRIAKATRKKGELFQFSKRGTTKPINQFPNRTRAEVLVCV